MARCAYRHRGPHDLLLHTRARLIWPNNLRETWPRAGVQRTSSFSTPWTTDVSPKEGWRERPGKGSRATGAGGASEQARLRARAKLPAPLLPVPAVWVAGWGRGLVTEEGGSNRRELLYQRWHVCFCNEQHAFL